MFLLRAFFILYFKLIISAKSTCPPGSVQGLSPNDCYKFFSSPNNFVQAERTCLNVGNNVHLASIPSNDENSFLSKESAGYFFNSDDFWVGGSTFESPGNWTWIDGTDFGYTNWAKDQPGAYSNDQCTSVYVLSGIWFSHNCSYAKPFICKLKPVDQSACTTQLAPTKPPQGFTCPSGWTFYEPTQKCFTMIRNMSYESADKACKSIGGILASIHNDEETMFLASFSSFGSMYPNNPTTQYPKQVFIGLFDPFHNQVWTWKDGTPVNYTNWEPNQPDNIGGTGQYCGSIASTWTDSNNFYHAWRIGGWDDEYCDYPLDSICQKKASHTI